MNKNQIVLITAFVVLSMFVWCNIEMNGNEEIIYMIQKKLEDKYLGHSSVAGISIGECDGEQCIDMLIISDDVALIKEIPIEVDGIRVRTTKVGEIKIQ